MQSTLLEKKTTSGKFWAPISAGPVCIAHPAHPIATPLRPSIPVICSRLKVKQARMSVV